MVVQFMMTYLKHLQKSRHGNYLMKRFPGVKCVEFQFEWSLPRIPQTGSSMKGLPNEHRGVEVG